jgi:S-adenosylmethionine-diacylglycerol 3-amino-3-carboxypropyl transferase
LSRKTLADTRANLSKAVHRSEAWSFAGALERAFTYVFKGLVYPQIWEDPDVDMQLLAIKPGARIVTIASGGCNVLSYLTANPGEVHAVDLNRAHIALTRLKLASATHLPDYNSFHRFFGKADERANVAAYESHVQPHLDSTSRSYWEGRDFTLRRRITLFSRDLYHHGLLGYFIGIGHGLCRLYGINPKDMLEARSVDEQRTFFQKSFAPLFDKRLIRWVTSKKMSLYGLGIPPAQYEALAAAGGGDMAVVLRERLERLACGFPLSENYFAWQAFGREYPETESGPLPPYLQRGHFDSIRERAGRVSVHHRAVDQHLATLEDASMDGAVLLDAQDWMTDDQLNALWGELTRTAKPGARVIFRTADEPSLLPGRVEADILDRWTYRDADSRQATAQDRSAIYGGCHLYVFNG